MNKTTLRLRHESHSSDSLHKTPMFIMYKIRSLTLILIGLFIAFNVFSQSPADSLTIDQVNAIKDALSNMEKVNSLWELGKYIVPVLTLIVGFLGGYAFYRKKVNDWADRQIDERLKKEYNIDWSVLKAMINEKSKRSNCKVAVLNAVTGKRDEIIDLLTNAGFPIPSFFTFNDTKDTSKHYFFSDKFDPNAFDFLLIDNEDGQLEEMEIAEKILVKQKDAFQKKILWFNPSAKLEKYEEYIKSIAVLQAKERIPVAIEQRL